jgi:hypothetical protein
MVSIRQFCRVGNGYFSSVNSRQFCMVGTGQFSRVRAGQLTRVPDISTEQLLENSAGHSAVLHSGVREDMFVVQVRF